jgi:hypothetical protein
MSNCDPVPSDEPSSAVTSVALSQASEKHAQWVEPQPLHASPSVTRAPHARDVGVELVTQDPSAHSRS